MPKDSKNKALKKKRGNYSIYKIEGEGDKQKETRVKTNLSHGEMSEALRGGYYGGEGFGYGGRRTYPRKKK